MKKSIDSEQGTYLALLIFVLLALIGCGSVDNPPIQAAPDYDAQIAARVESIRDWLPYCQYSADFRGVSKDTCLAEGTGTGDGDVLAYAGYLCLAGEEIGCETARRSIDSMGRAWRSPARVGHIEIANSFSRDMLLGLLAYLIATKDTDSAAKFLLYTEAIGGRLCPDALDNKCSMTPATYGLMKLVWQHIGLTPSPKMYLYAIIDDAVLEGQALTADAGYQLELIATHILLRQKLGDYNKTLERAAKKLTERQPENEYYELVYRGKTERFMQLFLAHAPQTAPASKFKWSVAPPSAERPWEASMGWEFIYMYGLIK